MFSSCAARTGVGAQIDLFTRKPILHVSGRYPARQGCLGLVIPAGAHPVNKNGVVVYDLRVDPGQWAGLSAEQLAAHLFTPRDELEGERLPLKIVSMNRCPVVTSPAALAPERAGQFGIDHEVCRDHWEYLVRNPELLQRFCDLFQADGGRQEDDPDFMIYSGFFGDDDRSHMETLRGIAPADLGRVDLPFRDRRLPEMQFRYRARNFPETLKGGGRRQMAGILPHAAGGPGRCRAIRAVAGKGPRKRSAGKRPDRRRSHRLRCRYTRRCCIALDKFSHIRPYRDHEIRPVLEQLLEDREFIDSMAAFASRRLAALDSRIGAQSDQAPPAALDRIGA